MQNPLEYAAKRLAQIEVEAQARKSRPGPRTPEGKHRSSQNALRHGLSGRVIVLPAEDRNLYLQFAHDFIQSLKPATPMEHELARNIADGYWRLKRVRTIEDSLYSLGYGEDESDLDAALSTGTTFRDHSKAFVNLSIYEQRIQRGIEKNTKLLRELQAERKSCEPQPEPTASTIAPQPKPLTVVRRFVYSAPRPSHEPTVSPSPQFPPKAA